MLDIDQPMKKSRLAVLGGVAGTLAIVGIALAAPKDPRGCTDPHSHPVDSPGASLGYECICDHQNGWYGVPHTFENGYSGSICEQYTWNFPPRGSDTGIGGGDSPGGGWGGNGGGGETSPPPDDKEEQCRDYDAGEVSLVAEGDGSVDAKKDPTDDDGGGPITDDGGTTTTTSKPPAIEGSDAYNFAAAKGKPKKPPPGPGAPQCSKKKHKCNQCQEDKDEVNKAIETSFNNCLARAIREADYQCQKGILGNGQLVPDPDGLRDCWNQHPNDGNKYCPAVILHRQEDCKWWGGCVYTSEPWDSCIDSWTRGTATENDSWDLSAEGKWTPIKDFTITAKAGTSTKYTWGPTQGTIQRCRAIQDAEFDAASKKAAKCAEAANDPKQFPPAPGDKICTIH